MRALALLLCLWSGGLSAVAVHADCRQALALGLDVSGSVDAQEYALQMQGLANALLHPEVTDALLQMPQAHVSLMVYEWSGPRDQARVLDWTPVRSTADLAAIAAQLRSAPRMTGDPSTAIGSALVSGAEALAERPECWKRTLDISGDGKSNTGPRPEAISRGPVMGDVTVNALVIGALVIGADQTRHRDTLDRRDIETGELVSYFRAYVIRGADAFVETALGFDDYEAAMVRKLKREVQSASFVMLEDPKAPPPQ